MLSRYRSQCMNDLEKIYEGYSGKKMPIERIKTDIQRCSIKNEDVEIELNHRVIRLDLMNNRPGVKVLYEGKIVDNGEIVRRVKYSKNIEL